MFLLWGFTPKAFIYLFIYSFIYLYFIYFIYLLNVFQHTITNITHGSVILSVLKVHQYPVLVARLIKYNK